MGAGKGNKSAKILGGPAEEGLAYWGPAEGGPGRGPGQGVRRRGCLVEEMKKNQKISAFEKELNNVQKFKKISKNTHLKSKTKK